MKKKRKGIEWIIFFCIAFFPLIGFPILMFTLLPFGALVDGYSFSYGITVATDMASQWYDVLVMSKGIWISLLLPLVFIVSYIRKIKKDKIKTQQETIAMEFVKKQQELENAISYQKVTLLTEREKTFYDAIRPIAEKYNLKVSFKTRLADIVNVNETIQKQTQLWWKNFEKISQKHIDFALIDETSVEIKLLIEVDDYTHQRIDRIERDEFVDSVCKQANIPILHLYDVVGLEEKIVNILHSEKTEQEM